MDLTRLRLLVELSRLGTMSAVAEVTGYRTSAVSKHLAVLEREAGRKLLEPVGRRVQLTPAGRRLVEHGIGILAAVDAAEAELAGESEPAGLVRIGSFATGAETVVVAALHSLAQECPRIEAHVYEHEPDETFELLLDGRIEVGLVYEYRLTPRLVPEGLTVRPLWEEPFLLALPRGLPALEQLPAADPAPGPDGSAAPIGNGAAAAAARPAEASTGGALGVDRLGVLADVEWITNSRGSDDDEVVQRLCAMAGFTPRIAHRVDSLHLVQSLVGAGFGIGLLPRLVVQPSRPGVELRALTGVPSTRRALLVHREGQGGWPPIAAVEEHIRRAVDRTVGRVLSVPAAGDDPLPSGDGERPAAGR